MPLLSPLLSPLAAPASRLAALLLGAAARRVAAAAAARSLSAAAEAAPPPPPALPPRGPRDVPAATERRVQGMFYDAERVRLSRRMKTVFSRADDEPPLAPQAEHGYLYGVTEADLAGRSDMVRRALSTRTASSAALRKFEKGSLVARFQTGHLDTGSSRVQVAALTERIERLTGHLGANKKDTHGKRTLLLLSSRRRRMLEYMVRRDYHNYRLVTQELGLRPIPVFNPQHLPKVRSETHAQIMARNARLKNRSSRGDRGH